ncbi:MAG: iron-containing alcohol dehydrogenase [Pseudomonadales bacterium]
MNTNFSFNSVSDLSIGAGAVLKLGDIAKLSRVSRLFVVTDKGVLEHGLLENALESLESAGVGVEIYSDVIADPPEQTVIDAAELARQKDCDGVLGFGGGSSMDTAKLVAALLTGNQPLSDMYGVDQLRGGRVPLIQVPTTAGTGSEVTMVAIVTTGESTKAGVVSRTLLADHVVLDPELTVGLPAHVTAATGIDAMVHAIEAYTSARLKNPLSDMVARQALSLMSPNIETATHNGHNLEARSAMLLGAMLAGQAFANAPVAAVHALAYPLGGVYHIPHGLSNSLVLPHVLRFNSQAASGLYCELAALLLPAGTNFTESTVGDVLAEHFLALAQTLGLQTRLRQFDISENSLAALADDAMLQQRLLINNPRALEHEDALRIYQQAY